MLLQSVYVSRNDGMTNCDIILTNCDKIVKCCINLIGMVTFSLYDFIINGLSPVGRDATSASSE